MTTTTTTGTCTLAPRIIHGEAREVLMGMPDASIDAIVTDPPYGLADLTQRKIESALRAWLGGDREFVPGGVGFMGASWDRFVPPPALWDEAFRVLKPGGYLLAFAGARTQDIMGLSLRLAGFGVRDVLAWLRSDAFNKSPHVLKSGYEPVLMAQRPVEGSIEQNLERWGTGSLNAEACRTPYASEADEAETKTKNAHGRFGTRNGGNAVYGTFADTERADYDPPGRWPANAVLDEDVAAELDGRFPDRLGGPSRFFPRFTYAGRAPSRERPVAPDGTKHDTVKPLSVMEWAVTLVTPPGGTVLDLFAGSGTTLEAAHRLGFDAVGIEREARYIPLIEQRIARATR